jgi:DNA invertase Pin-like site-specific DNA recombinase
MLVGYARVSTQEQDPALQLDALKKAGCEKIFVEKASGAQRDRPELMAALEFIREGDTLVVWKLDRLARSMKQLVETVEGMEAKGIGFRSLTEAMDTTTPGGKLIFHIFSALAEFERGIIKERTAAGLAAARARGKTGGRPAKMHPADIAAAKALLLQRAAGHDVAASNAGMIAYMFSVAEVAARVGVSEGTLYRHIPGGRSALEE